MTERFGIQDHDRQAGPQTMQNPTNPGTFQNISGGGDGGMSWGTLGRFGGGWSPDPNWRGYEGPFVPREKKLLVAIILAGIFGPFGLAYTTWRGAGVMLLLAGICARITSGGNDGWVWPAMVVGSIAWTIFAARACRTFRDAQLEKAREYLASQKSKSSE